MTIQVKEKQEITKPVVIADGTYMCRDSLTTTFIKITKCHFHEVVLNFDAYLNPFSTWESERFIKTSLELKSELVSGLIPCDEEEAIAVIDEFKRLLRLRTEVAA